MCSYKCNSTVCPMQDETVATDFTTQLIPFNRDEKDTPAHFTMEVYQKYSMMVFHHFIPFLAHYFNDFSHFFAVC
jgi:hypothetical protein